MFHKDMVSRLAARLPQSSEERHQILKQRAAADAAMGMMLRLGRSDDHLLLFEVDVAPSHRGGLDGTRNPRRAQHQDQAELRICGLLDHQINC